MKKFVLFALTAMALVACLVLGIFAAGTGTADNYIAKSGAEGSEVYYANLDEVVAAAKADSSLVINWNVKRVSTSETEDSMVYLEVFGQKLYFNTLAAAVDMAQDGAVITFVKKNATIVGAAVDGRSTVKYGTDGQPVEFDRDKNNGRSGSLTIDFNGCTYSIDGTIMLAGSNGHASQGMRFAAKQNVTLKNGTLQVKKNVLMLINNYSTLTIDNMTLDGSNISLAKGAYTLSTNTNDVVINNSTVIAKEGEGNYAFDVFDVGAWGKSGYQGSHTVTVNGNTKIVGNVELDKAGDAPADNTVGVIVNGGEITGTVEAKNAKAGVTVNGGSVAAINVTAAEKVAIKGGKVGALTVAKPGDDYVVAPAITGGVFGFDVSEFLDGNSTVEKIGDNYVVRSNSTTDRANHAHRFNKTWTTTSNMHWKGCACGEIMMKGPHNFGAAMTNIEGNTVYACKVCGFEKAA